MFVRGRQWTSFLFIASSIVAALLVIVAARWSWNRRAPDRQIAALVDAVGERRVYLGRLTGGFKHGPLVTPRRSEDAEPGALALAIAVAQIEQAAGERPTGDSLRVLAIAQLVRGNTDAAVRHLEQRVEQVPDDAVAQSDLSAAYLTRAKTNHRSDDLPRALAAAERAMRQQPNHLEARFNRAEAITALFLQTQAASAWKSYLEMDARSPWSTEARARLADVETRAAAGAWADVRAGLLRAASAGDRPAIDRAIAPYHQQVREWLEDELLPSWGRDVIEHRPGAAEALVQASTLAGSLESATGDRLLSDAVRAIGRVARERPGAALTSLAQGFVSYGEARRTYEANRVSASEPMFKDARARFDAAGNPMSLWCDFNLAIVDYFRGRIPETLAVVGRLAAEGHSRGYRSLEARAHWVAGLSRMFTASYTRQIDEYTQALDGFGALAEGTNAGAMENLLAGAYLYLGDQRQVWRHTVRSLESLGPLTPARRRHTQLAGVASRANKWGMPEVSLVFADETLDHASRWGAAEAFVEAQEYRARALAALGRTPEALAATTAGRARVASVPDTLIRERLAAELAQTEAETFAVTAPDRAVTAVRQALDYFERRTLLFRVPLLRLAEGRALRRLGDLDGAIRSLNLAAERFEAERANVPADDATRISHFDDVWQVYRELFEAQLTRHASDRELLDTAERGKSRSLAERLPAAGATDWADALRQATGPESAVVYYVQLEQETIAWVVTRAVTTRHRLPIVRGVIGRDVAALSDALARRAPRAEWLPSAARLHAALVEPLGLDPRVKTLAIVPDGTLARVPFSALWDARRQRFVGADRAIVFAPSARFLLASNARGASASSRARRVLAVAVDQASPEEGLAHLPAAEGEARMVVRALPDGIVLAGPRATRDAVAQALSGVDLFHFAGHTVANPEFPELSRFFLSDGAGGVAVMLAEDLRRLPLDRLQLVVLASCSSVEGPLSNSEGLLGLARAFLAQGVASVLVTRWAVDDAETRRFVQRFYARLGRNERTPAALAGALQESLEHQDRGDEWAAWLLIGGEIGGSS